LDFLQDPKSESKADQTVEAVKKQTADSERSEGSLSTLTGYSASDFPALVPTKIICMAETSTDHLKKGQQAFPPSQYHSQITNIA